jgi:hypothetical protein
MEGKRIVITDDEGYKEALAVYVNWTPAEIASNI